MKDRTEFNAGVRERFLKCLDDAIQRRLVKNDAAASGILETQSSGMSLIRNGDFRNPTLRHIALLCQKLGYNISYLVYGTGAMRAANNNDYNPALSEIGLERLEKKLKSTLDELDLERRENKIKDDIIRKLKAEIKQEA